MLATTNTYPEFEYIPESGMGALYFHRWLMRHPKLYRYNGSVEAIIYNSAGTDKIATGWSELLSAVDMMEGAHFHDFRKSSGKPYVTHQFEIISDYLRKYEAKDINLHDILILLLHDVLEDRPSYWRPLLNQFGLQTFRDVLILSTGGIKEDYRKEMLEYFAYQYGDTLGDAPLGTPLHDIRHILSPADPLYKLENFSKYSGDKTSPEFDAMQRAIVDYAKYFLGQDPSSAVKDTNDLAFDEEYLALCNYIYMKKADLRRKLQDMLNNMNDMNEMGPDYIEKRQIKGYILLVLLNNNGMHEEVTELKSKFQSLGHPMFSPAEILDRIEKKLSKRKKLS